MTAYDPLPLAQQPDWLRELDVLVEVFPVEPRTGGAVAYCRACAMVWGLPLARLEENRYARAMWVTMVARHGMEHAARGELLVDEHGCPITGAQEDVQWPN